LRGIHDFATPDKNLAISLAGQARPDATIYDYNTIPLNPTLGAGKLHTIDGPLSDDTITFEYDELGRVINQGIEGGEDSVVHYDSLGRVNWTENALGHFDHTYDGVTPRLTQTVAQAIGQTTNYVYFGNDHDRRLQTLENLATGGANLSKFDYTYDAEGEIMTWNRQLGTATSGCWFGYDDARQLLSARNASNPSFATQKYEYGYVTGAIEPAIRISIPKDLLEMEHSTTMIPVGLIKLPASLLKRMGL
jgi:hypothetical protein